MPKIVDAAQKRRDILAAAAITFARHGREGTNLHRVATAAGMGKSSLYHYFPTREALFAALVDDVLRHEAALFESLAAAPAPAPARLAALVDAIVGMFAQWAKLGPLLVAFLGEPRGRRRMRETFRTARAAIARLVRDGQREGEFRPGPPETLAAVVLGCLDGLFLQELVEPRSTGDAATAGVLRDMLVAALRSPEAR